MSWYRIYYNIGGMGNYYDLKTEIEAKDKEEAIQKLYDRLEEEDQVYLQVEFVREIDNPNVANTRGANKMKLTKEDIQKYGTPEEKKILKEGLRKYYTADDIQVGDYVTFMNNRGWNIVGYVIKKFENRARVQDEDTGDMYTPQYSQLAKLDKPK